MSEWHKNIVAFHKLDNADDPDSLVLGSPANAATIAVFEKTVGYSMPEEFKALETIAYAKGFLMVSASPLTRSSHHAGDDFARLKAARLALSKA